MEAANTEAFQRRLNSRSEPSTKLVAKTPIPQVLARVSLCWPLMSVCGKNVDSLRACRRSNRDFLRLYTGNTYIFSYPPYITRGVLRCLLGFLALWGQKPCGGNNRVFLSRNYRLIVAPRKLDVLKTNISPRSEASRANMLVLRTSNFQGATITPIVPRHKHSIVFIVHH